MAYTTINKHTAHFNTKLYTGNGSTGNAQTGVGFQPDLVWIKNRSDSNPHCWTDAVRGATKYIESDTTDAEDTNTEFLQSFNSDGFTVGNSGRVNTNGNNYASWNWKASGSTASNTDGTNITSTVSANTTAGFSIVSYTGSGTISDTVGHGLGTTPKVVILKNRDSASAGWIVHHSSLSSGYNMQLQSNGAQFNSTGQGHLGTVGSSTFGFVAGSSGNDQVNDSSDKYIAYCFAEKTGYSKFGKYSGNGSTDGTFVYTGFKPAWVMIKRTDSTANWRMIDSKRNAYNILPRTLTASQNAVEYTGTDDFGNTDILSNGFKIKTSYAEANASGGSYIYMAFGQSLVGTNNVVANAR